MTLLIVQVRPWGLALARGAPLRISATRILGVVLVTAAFVVGGGVVALLVGGATRPKQAIAYGMGWQGLVGGVLRRGHVPD